MANYHVQWTGQYYVAYELSRRGYVATLTVGNAPELDILARSPNGKSFSVEVKTMRESNFWRFGEPINTTDFWFFVALNEGKPQVAIMIGEEVKKEWNNYFEHWCKTHPSTNFDKGGSNWGITLGTVKKHVDRWEIIPE